MTLALIPAVLLLALASGGLALYGFVAWLEYREDRTTYDTAPNAALRYALAWPIRVYHFWRAN